MICLFLFCFVIDFIWCDNNYVDLSQFDYYVNEEFGKLTIKFNPRSLAMKIRDSNNNYVNKQSVNCNMNETKTFHIKLSNGTRSVSVKYNILCVTNDNSKNVQFINEIFAETRPNAIYVGWIHANTDEISDHIVICNNNIGEEYQQNMKDNSFILIGVKENVSYQICVATVNRKSLTSTFKCSLVQYKSGSSKSTFDLTNKSHIKNKNKMRIINNENVKTFSSDEFYKLFVSPNIQNFNSSFYLSMKKIEIYWEIIEDMQGSIFEFIVIFINAKSECEYLIHFQCENCLFPLNLTVLSKENRKYRDQLLMCKNNFTTKFKWKDLKFQYISDYKNISTNYTISIHGTNMFGVHKLYSYDIASNLRNSIVLLPIIITVISVFVLFLFIIIIGIRKSENALFRVKMATSPVQTVTSKTNTFRNSDGKNYSVFHDEDVSILKFENYYGHLLKKEQSELNKTFAKLKRESKNQELILKLTANAGMDASNNSKNRFKNILPYDENRVKVGDKGLPDDYINASYIKSDFNDKKIDYIASQAPNEETLPTFWQMIWEQNIQFIIMLTQLEEGTHHKCIQYWPNTIGEKLFFGDNSQFSVIMIETTNTNEYTERKLILSYNDCQHKKIFQLHMNTWFDYSAPDLEYFDRFLFRFHEITNSNHEDPYLVHCSAGVGRTGTFICIDKIIKDLINGEQRINIFEKILRLRRNRICMVQRKAQFKFIHDYINHFLKTYMIFNNNDEAIYCNQSQF